MHDKIIDSTMTFAVVVFFAIFLVFHIFDGSKTKDANEKLYECQKQNYTFVYKQRELSKKTTTDFLDKVKQEHYSLEEKKKSKDGMEYCYSVDDEKYLLFMVKKQEKQVLAFNVKKGNNEYMTLQCATQLGYKVLHNQKICSKKETQKLLKQVERDENCIIEYNDEKKTAEVID